MLTARQIFDELDHYTKVGYNHLTFDTQGHINDLVQQILQTFSNPDFHLTKDEGKALITANHILANVVAMSPIKTTDSVLIGLNHHPLKQMILYTVRNQLQLDYTRFFDYDIELASLWYDMFLQPAAGRTTELLFSNSVRHLTTIDARYQPTKRAVLNYFIPTYIDSDMIDIKEHINIQFQQIAPGIKNYPQPKQIALVADRWVKGHAVYKSMYRFIEALVAKYDLTLVALGPEDSRLDTGLFKFVKRVKLDGPVLNVSEIQDNNFQLAIFCDVGMSIESIKLANTRIAPIQIATHGHPISTWGSKIDYFLTGLAVEKEDGQKHYSEKLLFLPGSGAHPTRPPKLARRPHKGLEPIICNIPWGVAKYNYWLLNVLKDVQKQSTLKVVYHFYPGCGLDRYNCANPYFQDMSRLFPTGAVYFPNQAYSDYLENLAKAHFGVDSYPFGSYNSIVDQLCLGMPVITWEGPEWYNRAASYLLKKVGLSELVATNLDEYIQLMLKLINNQDYRLALTTKIEQTDLSILFENDEPKYFVKVVESLL